MDVSAGFTLLGLALAWMLYRFERASSRRRDIDAARGVLLGVKHGMVGKGAEEGWGARYFTNRWTDEKSREVGKYHEKLVLTRGYEQVLVVPTEPLAALVASPAAGDLISEDTVYAANVGLWYLHGFNQFELRHFGWTPTFFTQNGRTTPRRRAATVVSVRQCF